MGVFLIIMGIVFLVLTYRNMKAGLGRDWLIWTLVTIAMLVGFFIPSQSHSLHDKQKSGLCSGFYQNLDIWAPFDPLLDAVCLFKKSAPIIAEQQKTHKSSLQGYHITRAQRRKV